MGEKGGGHGRSTERGWFPGSLGSSEGGMQRMKKKELNLWENEAKEAQKCRGRSKLFQTEVKTALNSG